MNFRGILSKSSLKSSSSGKSLTHTEEISKLQTEIESLKETIDALKISVESRDAAIGTLAREKEKIYVEFKSAQRTNRNIHQQLVDERDIHSKEKDFLINEIKRLSNRNDRDDRVDARQNEDGNEDQTKTLYDEIKAKDEVIYNIGAKYMKIKSSKVTLQKRLEKLEDQNKKTCENIIFLLQDNRKTLDHLLDNLLKNSTVSPDSKKYLNLLQINASLHYENTQLKIYLSAKDSEVQHQESSTGQELSEQACSIEKNSKSVANKNKGLKIKNPNEKCQESRSRRRTIHSKLKSLTSHDCPKLTSLKYIHRKFSSNYRGNALYRSASDSCIIRINSSELLNMAN